MSLPKQPFSWDDDRDETPIPLGENDGDEVVGMTAAVVEEAEVVVREAQDAIARQDTDPVIPLSLLASGTKEFAARLSAAGRRDLHSSSGTRRRPLKAVTVVAACAIAFAHGWHQGSVAAAHEAASESSVVKGYRPFVSQVTVQQSPKINSGRRCSTDEALVASCPER